MRILLQDIFLTDTSAKNNKTKISYVSWRWVLDVVKGSKMTIQDVDRYNPF